VLFLDEIEKGLAGWVVLPMTAALPAGGRDFSAMAERSHSEVFVIATCNDYSKLPPEYTRMGRWDAIFFVDNPSPKERLLILGIYSEAFGVKTSPKASRPGGLGGLQRCRDPAGGHRGRLQRRGP